MVAAHRSELDHLNLGKGCIRYRKPEDVDYELVRSMLRETVDSRGRVC